MTTASRVATTSLRVITELQVDGGAYPASPDFSAYRGYCWLRDGAFIADGVSAAGEPASADRFFDWCAATITRHADGVAAAVEAAGRGEPLPADRMLPARFTYDGGLGTDPWWDFQLDGYGTWLWALVAHTDRHRLDPARWHEAVELTVRYLVSSWDRPCYDWWEEHGEQVHVSTLGCIGAGLEAASRSGVLAPSLSDEAAAAAAAIRARVAQRGVAGGHLTKWLGRSDVDGSLSALVAPMGWLEAGDPVAVATVAAVDAALADEGGVHRFADDVFYGGGRWPLLTCFLGLAKLATGDRAGAERALAWAASTASEDGLLPEQVGDRLLAPGEEAVWVERWGTVARPLLWSHGEYLRLWDALGRP